MSDLERFGEALAPLYHLSRELSTTTAGSAFQGLTSEGQSCRLMLLPPSVCAAMEAPAGFTHELERAGRFSHPGILPPLGAGMPTPELAYFGFEDPSEPSAREVVRSQKALPAETVAQIGATLADVIAGIHAAGLLHGFITPDTVFISSNRQVRLAGVGVYQSLIAAGVPPSVLIGELGLEHYLSPEQITGKALDSRTDVYLLGVVLYELLTGMPPFGGRTTSTVMVSVLADEPTKTAPGGARAPGRTVAAILRAIEKHPDDRWPTMESFGKALEALDPSEPRGLVRRNPGCLAVMALTAGIGAALVVRW